MKHYTLSITDLETVEVLYAESIALYISCAASASDVAFRIQDLIQKWSPERTTGVKIKFILTAAPVLSASVDVPTSQDFDTTFAELVEMVRGLDF